MVHDNIPTIFSHIPTATSKNDTQTLNTITNANLRNGVQSKMGCPVVYPESTAQCDQRTMACTMYYVCFDPYKVGLW